MLGARKLELLAGLKVRGLNLRQAEMDFYMTRFKMTAGLSSVMTCLAYVGVIKIKVPHEMLPPDISWQVAMFYISACAAMALSMCAGLPSARTVRRGSGPAAASFALLRYNLVVTSFCVVYAQGLALRGPPGSVAKSVRMLCHL